MIFLPFVNNHPHYLQLVMRSCQRFGQYTKMLLMPLCVANLVRRGLFLRQSISQNAKAGSPDLLRYFFTA